MADAVGVVGLGNMGGAIAARLIDVGRSVRVFDVDARKAEPPAERGAAVAASPGDVARGAEPVILSLPHEAAVEAAVFGEDGISGAGRRGAPLIDMSSISPARTRALAERLGAEAGMVWVDCPLSGGAPKVAHGALAVMVGGDAAALAAIRPVMSELASAITLVGPVGAGQAAKLVNQLLAGCAFQALAEAATLARACGVDVAALPTALEGGRADSAILREFLPMMASGDHAPTGTLRSMVRDFANIEEEAARHALPLPLTALAGQLHRLAGRHGLADAPNAAIVDLYAERPPP